MILKDLPKTLLHIANSELKKLGSVFRGKLMMRNFKMTTWYCTTFNIVIDEQQLLTRCSLRYL